MWVLLKFTFPDTYPDVGPDIEYEESEGVEFMQLLVLHPLTLLILYIWPHIR